MRDEDRNESAGRQAAMRWALDRAQPQSSWMGQLGVLIEAFEAGRASVLGDTSEPLSEHGLCSCGALDPCEGGHP